MNKVFIAVGHGGRDPGAVANNLREADCNLVMALAMEKLLLQHGLEVQLSRHTDCTNPVAEEIAACQKFQPQLAVVIHNNAGGGHGFEVYHPVDSYMNDSITLALLMEQEIRLLGQLSRGLKQNNRLRWMRKCICPTVLCEGFFLDSEDYLLAQTAEQQASFGEAYARAVLRWFEEKNN